MWKDTMLNQFHDVLPGTSIQAANEDVREIYARRITQGTELLRDVLARLCGEGSHLTVLDPLRLRRLQVMEMPHSVSVPDGSSARTGERRLGFIKTDQYGVGQVIPIPDGIVAPRAYREGDSFVLENTQYRLRISNGRIASLIDLRLRRELIAAGPGTETGGLMLYEDLPLAYDAWDAEIYHLDCCRELEFGDVEVINGSLRSSLRATAKFGSSTVHMMVCFAVDVTDTQFSLDAVGAGVRSPWIRVDVDAQWAEKHKFLKCGYRRSVHTSDIVVALPLHCPCATYGTQFGLVDRPTHRNTTLDQAKFEVCAHMLADLSEAGYGVAIASTFKYGYAVEGNTMRWVGKTILR
jgi:alpha-mannosidase